MTLLQAKISQIRHQKNDPENKKFEKLDFIKKQKFLGKSLEIEWLRIQASTAGGADLIPNQGTKRLHAMWRSQKKTFF